MNASLLVDVADIGALCHISSEFTGGAIGPNSSRNQPLDDAFHARKSPANRIYTFIDHLRGQYEYYIGYLCVFTGAPSADAIDTSTVLTQFNCIT